MKPTQAKQIPISNQNPRNVWRVGLTTNSPPAVSHRREVGTISASGKPSFSYWPMGQYIFP